MDAATYEGVVVEDGHVRILSDVQLPVRARVLVVVPGVDQRPDSMIASPHLASREDAVEFVLEVEADEPL